MSGPSLGPHRGFPSQVRRQGRLPSRRSYFSIGRTRRHRMATIHAGRGLGQSARQCAVHPHHGFPWHGDACPRFRQTAVSSPFCRTATGRCTSGYPQVGSGRFTDLDQGPALDQLRLRGEEAGSRRTARVRRTNPDAPLIGGEPRPFLGGDANHPSWSPDGASLVYFRAVDGDPLYIADRSGGNAREIFKDRTGSTTTIRSGPPTASGFTSFMATLTEMLTDIWRIRPSRHPGDRHRPRRAGELRALLDARTLLFVAPAEDRGPVAVVARCAEQADTTRHHGVEQYLSVAASADGRRIVATVANGSASLCECSGPRSPGRRSDVKPLPVPSVRALGPRIHGGTLFYSSRGARTGCGAPRKGQTSEI